LKQLSLATYGLQYSKDDERYPVDDHGRTLADVADAELNGSAPSQDYHIRVQSLISPIE
jgi:hypothetical protein